MPDDNKNLLRPSKNSRPASSAASLIGAWRRRRGEAGL